jgi:hypothetical protein
MIWFATLGGLGSSVLIGCGNHSVSRIECAESLLSASMLGSDLTGERREGVYRAYWYVKRKGTCVKDMPEADADTVEEWRAYSKRLWRWLVSQDLAVLAVLVERYPAFVTTWSPVFKD